MRKEQMASADVGNDVVGGFSGAAEGCGCGVLPDAYSDKLAGDASGWAFSVCFFNASAWRFGGPRRLLGLS